MHILLTLAFFIGGLQPSMENIWTDNFEEGQTLARETNRDLLVDFTGSDWCKWCKLLDGEVFDLPEFVRSAQKDYVLVRVDLPRTARAIAGVRDMEGNRELAAKYAIQKWPTVLLMTAGGDVYGRTGYQKGGAPNYLNHMAEMREEGRPPLIAALILVDEFESAPESARVAIATKAIVAVRALEPDSSGVPKLMPLVGHILEVDHDNEEGLLVQALRVLLPSGYASKAQIERGESFDPKNEEGVLELAVLARVYAAKNERQMRKTAQAINELDAIGPIKDTEVAMALYANGATWNDRYLRDLKQAKHLARKAKPLVKKDPRYFMQVQAILSKR
ncbi:MAG: thioredoxin-related protein [Planctomycetota bacterium]|jgi:thioredoxin-related protein